MLKNKPKKVTFVPRVTIPKNRANSKPSSFLRNGFVRFFQKKLNILASTVLCLIILISLSAHFITTDVFRVNPLRQNLHYTFQAPGFTEQGNNGELIVHWLGTDSIGRDWLARLLDAGDVSLLVGFLVMLITAGIGVPLGLISGYFGGWVDDVINVAIQFVLNLPTFYLFIVLGKIFRPSPIFLAFWLGLFGWATIARQTRGLTLSLKHRFYIDAAVVSGANPVWILFYHIFPNTLSILLVLSGIEFASAILAEAALSFLGFGIVDPDISWGKLLSESSQYLTYSDNHNPFLIIGPGIAISVTVLSLYLVSDGLRDAFDPN